MLDRENFRPAQNRLVDLVCDYECGVLVLGCGGGKTVSMMTAILDLARNRDIDYAVVLAPVTVVSTAWPKEPERWRHLLGTGVVPLLGTPAKRRKLLEERDEQGIFVCSIDNVVWLMDTLEELDWPFDRTMLVIDEISKFKTPASKRRKKLQELAPLFDSRWGLTGTPRPNGYEDLFGPLKLIAGPDVWGVRDFDTWRETFFVKQDYHGFVYKPNELLIDRLDAVARKYMFHLPDGDLDTPELLEGEAFDRWVGLTDDQQDAYDDMVEELMVELGDDPDEALVIEAMSQGVASGKLTQIVQGFMYHEEDGERLCHRFDPNPKLGALTELLEEIGGDSAAIAYHYREELAALRKLLGKDTPNIGAGTTAKQAGQIIEAWSAGEIDRLLVHPASMGHGTDGLQHGGHHLIWYHLPWSAEQAHQTIHRFKRPGQTHPVRNWRLLARGTNDEIKDARVYNKDLDAAEFLKKLRRA